MSRARRFARCLKVVALCTLATIYAPSEAAREQSIRFGDIDAVVWTPDVNSDKPLPVVVSARPGTQRHSRDRRASAGRRYGLANSIRRR